MPGVFKGKTDGRLAHLQPFILRNLGRVNVAMPALDQDVPHELCLFNRRFSAHVREEFFGLGPSCDPHHISCSNTENREDGGLIECPHAQKIAAIAQLVERRVENAGVGGSTPPCGTKPTIEAAAHGLPPVGQSRLIAKGPVHQMIRMGRCFRPGSSAEAMRLRPRCLHGPPAPSEP